MIEGWIISVIAIGIEVLMLIIALVMFIQDRKWKKKRMMYFERKRSCQKCEYKEIYYWLEPCKSCEDCSHFKARPQDSL